MLEIIQLPVLNDNYIYLIHEPVSKQTAVVDPALAQPVLDKLNDRDWHLTHILNTHHHWDHVGGNLELKEQTGCTIYASSNDQHRIPGIDIILQEGDSVSLGSQKAMVLETPGHTLGHIVYYFSDAQALFCGDTLFVMGCGRLFEGTAQQMRHSLLKLQHLPSATRFYCAHEYTQANGRFALSIEPDNIDLQHRMQHIDLLRSKNRPTVPSTIAEELKTNPFFRSDSPGLQATLNFTGRSELDVFAETRRRKDHY